MQQLNVNDYYELGKQTEAVETLIKGLSDPIAGATVAWQLFIFKWKLQGLLQEPCALLNSSQRAVKAIISAIDSVVSEELGDMFDPQKPASTVHAYQLTWIQNAISSFETIIKNDMPEMSTFAVSQIGILRTDDLIYNAYRQVAEPLRLLLLDKAKADIIEAGKCLAFRLSTASAFHICRAIETGMDQFHTALAGKPFEISPSGGNNNWGNRIKELIAEGADERITEFLLHIKKQYRNPVTHPEVVIDEHEAIDLFGTALSAISMMLSEVKALNEKAQSSFAGFAEALGTLTKIGLPQASDEE